MRFKTLYLFLGRWWEWHAIVTSGHSNTGGNDKLASGVKVTEIVDLFVGTKAWLWMAHISGRVTGMVVLNHQVEKVLVVGVGVSSGVTGVNPDLAAFMERSWNEQKMFYSYSDATEEPTKRKT